MNILIQINSSVRIQGVDFYIKNKSNLTYLDQSRLDSISIFARPVAKFFKPDGLIRQDSNIFYLLYWSVNYVTAIEPTCPLLIKQWDGVIVNPTLQVSP